MPVPQSFARMPLRKRSRRLLVDHPRDRQNIFLGTLILALCFFYLNPAAAGDYGMPTVITKAIPTAALVGSGDLSYMIFDVYTLKLFAPEGIYAEDRPYALEWDYKRSVSGARITSSILAELRHEGIDNEERLAAWKKDLDSLDMNAEDGTVFVGVYNPGQPTCFYKDDDLLGCEEDISFGPAYFGIWLAPTSTEPKLRREILGQTK